VSTRQLGWPVYLDESGQVGAVGRAGSVRLTGAEGRHAAAVRRHRPGDVLVVTDGAGAWVAGPVRAVRGKAEVELEVVQQGFEPAPTPRLTVVLGLLKSDRSDLAVDQLTEVGVDRIVGWSAQRCVANWSGERVGRGLHRWRRAAAEAAKQSRRVRLPEVSGVADTAAVAALVAAADGAFVCHESATAPLAAQLSSGSQARQAAELVIVVGPEGGITDAEVATLSAAGAVPASLGPTVLRAALAGTVAAALLLAAAGRLAPDGRLSPGGPVGP